MNKFFLEYPCCLSGKIEITFKLDTEPEAEQSSKIQSAEDGAGDIAWPSPAALKSKAAPQFHRHHTFPESTELLVKNDCSYENAYFLFRPKIIIKITSTTILLNQVANSGLKWKA